VIEETGTVVDVEAGFAWVETRRQSTCGQCSARQGCGSAALARVLGRRRTRVRALDPVTVQVGEQVVLGLEEAALVRGSLAVYLAPLAGLLLGALFGDFLADRLLLAGEAASILGGLLGAAAGVAWLRGFGRGIRNDRRYQPVILRRSAGAPRGAGVRPAPH
jgi:sigma-E factor negative regulatory protein RseC